MAAEIREQHAPFHWWLEFPEVFYEERPDPLDGGAVNGAAMMEAFVGNPPFAGKNTISAASGDEYTYWLMANYAPAHGNADLSAYFLRRMIDLIGDHGTVATISTNTIAQGDTRETGLRHVTHSGGATIYDTIRTLPWPGAAAVHVSTIHLARGAAANVAQPMHDGVRVSAINSRLEAGPERPEPVALAANVNTGFAGAKLFGQGFVLSATEKAQLIADNPSNAERVQAYIGGAELNSLPSLEPDRYIINFGYETLDEAGRWPDLLEIARTRVKPERESNKRQTYRTYWWRLGEPGAALYSALDSLSRCIVCCQVSKHVIFAFQATSTLFAHTLCVFSLQTNSALSVLQSRAHEGWARLLSSSLEDRLRYAPSDCFDTFPFPHPDPRTVIPDVESAGKAFYEARASFMLDTNQGLTKTYNALKDPNNTDPAVLELRRLTEAMDRAVLDAYGWTDLDVPPYCPKTNAEQAAHKAFEDEVIDRLYVLNAERAREEERLGLGKKGKKQGKRASKKAKPSDDGGQQSLL
jgi:hypothetical protein